MNESEIDGVIIKKRWLVPQLGLNAGTVYQGRPVGNSPEFMPLDNSLNADITRSHDFHCRATASLHKDDPRRFSMATPKTISQGIHRLFQCDESQEGVPSSSRIIHDCDQVWDSMETVLAHDGAVVEDLCNRNGICYRRIGEEKRGGFRAKNEYSWDDWVEPMALTAINEIQLGIISNDIVEQTSDNDSSSTGTSDS